MLKRQQKNEPAAPKGPPRILVVDDNPDAAHLIAKLFRREGFEVAEVGDHQVALLTLMNEPEPISAVVVSFSGLGNAACLKLLDGVRHAPDSRVTGQRMVLILDAVRQMAFSWQSGADGVLTRPYPAEVLIEAVREAIKRPDDQRPVHRRQMIDKLREESEARAHQPTPIAAAQFN